MNNKLYIGVIVLCSIIGIYFINLSTQNNYQSSSKKLIDFNAKSVNKIIIQTHAEAIEFLNTDGLWSIVGHDSLQLKESQFNSFLNNLGTLEIQNIMTEKKEKWFKYNVLDSTGSHLALIDSDNNTLGYFVFGNSKTDYARCYVRKNQNSNVYLLNQNMTYILQPKPHYWGEVESSDLEATTTKKIESQQILD